MAEPVTQDPVLDAPPVSSDNGASPDGATGADAGQHAETPPEPVWQRLGHRDEADLVETYTRQKQQATGSNAEFQRLQREIAVRDGRLAEIERARTAPTPPGEATAPAYRTHREAYTAYLEGKDDALDVYEAHSQQTQQSAIRAAVVDTIQQLTKPAQYVNPVVTKFPDLDKRDSALYKEAYTRYATYANDPYFRTLYPADPAALRTLTSPDGMSQQAMDTRILYHVAQDIEKDQAFERGRAEEAKARGATGQPRGNAAPARTATPSDAPLLYDDEVVNDPRVIAAMAAAGRGVDPRTQRKRYWESMPVAEKRRRQALHESGTWTGRRG